MTVTVNDRTDSQLVHEVRGGSSEAAEVLFERHWPRAWQAAYAVLGDRTRADDAAQSAIERGFRSLDSFDARRPFGPWIARIAVNQALNGLRQAGREVAFHEVAHAAADAVGAVDARLELLGAVGRLEPGRRVVIALRYWLDLDPPEIAELLGIPVGTVSSRLSRALSDLRHELGAEVASA